MTEGSILLAHGGGGILGHDLIERVFLKHLGNPVLNALEDAALIQLTDERGQMVGQPALTTDSYVVQPIFFPGGDIGKLAICGTVNDLAMRGAEPVGIGLIPPGVHISASAARPGDVVMVSGAVGDHGLAIMTQREGLRFDSPLRSDCAPLNLLVRVMIEACPGIHVLRDPTRGGLATTLNELAARSGVGFEIEEASVPVHEPVRVASELLGLDPLYVANEGKLVAIVEEDEASALLSAMRSHPFGREAAIIGRVVAEHPGRVVLRTLLGTRRALDMLAGEQLPRIC